MVKKLAIIGAVCLALAAGVVIWFFVAFWRSMERGDERARQVRAEQASGKSDFGDQPALFAAAQAILSNNPEAIRATVKALPDLNTPGRDGATLLSFAVTQSWQRRELVEAVKTLLSLGADPNYTNGRPRSFAMANAVHSSEPVLRAMLEADGNPNTRDEFDRPIVLMTWYLGYYKDQERMRLDLLLDRGADINSTLPARANERCPGYSLLLYRTEAGPRYPEAYADALHLLERGADPKPAGTDGMTLAKMLAQHSVQFLAARETPMQFITLWNWASEHGILSDTQ